MIDNREMTAWLLEQLVLLVNDEEYDLASHIAGQLKDNLILLRNQSNQEADDGR